MKIYILSVGAGILVGAIYALLGVRSPAPPVVALVGLLGILIGEQAVPLIKHAFAPQTADRSAFRRDATNHVFGQLPGRSKARSTADVEREVDHG